MRLSKAILDGIKQAPHHSPEVFFRHGSVPLAASTLGAALLGLEQSGFYFGGGIKSMNPKAWTELGVWKKICHPISDRKMLILDIVNSLEEHHGWTREQIAEWLDRHEL